MELKPLGRTGLLVSPVGLGTVKLGRNEAVKYPEPFELPSDEAARELLDTARALGVNLLDTAPAYGVAEERLGRLLEGTRDQWVLCTKVGEEFEAGRSRFDFSPEHTFASVDRSLQRLRTDHLDAVLVHSNGEDEAALHAGVMDALARCKAEGKARTIGFSPKSPDGALAALPHCDVLMLTLNPAEPKMLPVVRAAHEAGVGVLIKKGLQSGHLPAVADPVAACLRFLFAEPGVSALVVGTINPAHLRENVAAAERALTSRESD